MELKHKTYYWIIFYDKSNIKFYPHLINCLPNDLIKEFEENNINNRNYNSLNNITKFHTGIKLCNYNYHNSTSLSLEDRLSIITSIYDHIINTCDYDIYGMYEEDYSDHYPIEDEVNKIRQKIIFEIQKR